MPVDLKRTKGDKCSQKRVHCESAYTPAAVYLFRLEGNGHQLPVLGVRVDAAVFVPLLRKQGKTSELNQELPRARHKVLATHQDVAGDQGAVVAGGCDIVEADFAGRRVVEAQQVVWNATTKRGKN